MKISKKLFSTVLCASFLMAGTPSKCSLMKYCGNHKLGFGSVLAGSLVLYDALKINTKNIEQQLADAKVEYEEKVKNLSALVSSRNKNEEKMKGLISDRDDAEWKVSWIKMKKSRKIIAIVAGSGLIIFGLWRLFKK